MVYPRQLALSDFWLSTLGCPLVLVSGSFLFSRFMNLFLPHLVSPGHRPRGGTLPTRPVWTDHFCPDAQLGSYQPPALSSTFSVLAPLSVPWIHNQICSRSHQRLQPTDSGPRTHPSVCFLGKASSAVMWRAATDVSVLFLQVPGDSFFQPHCPG